MRILDLEYCEDAAAERPDGRPTAPWVHLPCVPTVPPAMGVARDGRELVCRYCGRRWGADFYDVIEGFNRPEWRDLRLRRRGGQGERDRAAVARG